MFLYYQTLIILSIEKETHEEPPFWGLKILYVRQPDKIKKSSPNNKTLKEIGGGETKISISIVVDARAKIKIAEKISATFLSTFISRISMITIITKETKAAITVILHEKILPMYIRIAATTTINLKIFTFHLQSQILIRSKNSRFRVRDQYPKTPTPTLFLARRIIFRSRLTFAIIDAAEIMGIFSSPFMIVSCKYPSGANREPSKKIFNSEFLISNFSRHLLTASRSAYEIPLLSIIEWLTDEETQKILPSRFNILKSKALSEGGTCFESRMRWKNLKLIGAKTAPTVTGPAKGPLPASSIPIIYFTAMFI